MGVSLKKRGLVDWMGRKIKQSITLSTRVRVGRYGEGSIESQWTGIALATTDHMNFISSTEGAMQCSKTVSVVDLAASRFHIPCEYRGPVSAC